MNKPLVTELFEKYMAARREFEEHPTQKNAKHTNKKHQEWLALINK